MTSLVSLSPQRFVGDTITDGQQRQLLSGDILIETRSHTDWGGAVTAQMYVAVPRATVWNRITDYPRWVTYFPDLTHSRVLSDRGSVKRLYHAACKSVFMLSVQVEAYLQVVERGTESYDHVQFTLEQGSFKDFSADLTLRTLQNGTWLTYCVRATPSIWVPSLIIQEAMRFDLPNNMRSMRRALVEAMA